MLSLTPLCAFKKKITQYTATPGHYIYKLFVHRHCQNPRLSCWWELLNVFGEWTENVVQKKEGFFLGSPGRQPNQEGRSARPRQRAWRTHAIRQGLFVTPQDSVDGSEGCARTGLAVIGP